MLGSFTMRRMRSTSLLVGCLTATVLVTSALVSALVSFYVSALPASVHTELAQSGAMAVAINGNANGRPAAEAAGLAARLTKAFGSVPYRLDEATWSDDLAVPGVAHPGRAPIIEAAAVSGIEANADLVTGAWPGSSRQGRPIPAALPESVATDLGLRVGSVLSLRDSTTGDQVGLQVTGLYRPVKPAAPYWQIDLISPSGVAIGGGFASYGPAVVSQAAFGSPRAGLLVASQVSFVAQPRVAAITLADLTPLARRLDTAMTAIDSTGQLTANSTIPVTLDNAAAALATARSLVLISGLQLILLAAAALALASRLLASYREGETALLSARGAARRQLIAPSLAEAVLAVAASAAAGLFAGNWLSAALLARLTGQPAGPLAIAATAWVAAAILAVFCLAIVMWPAARPPRPGEARIRRGRSAPVATAVAAGADIALIVLAVLAVRELRSYSAATHSATGSGLDPVIAVAPALALAGLAIVPLRLLPVAARGLERLTARGKRLGSAMANWEISRRPLRQSGPVLLLILAVGASTVALAQYQSWRQSVQDQAQFAVGAQVRVDLPQPAPPSGGDRIASLPGVTAAMPVSMTTLSSGQLLVLDAALAQRTVTLRPDLARQPAAQLFGTIMRRARPGLVLPGRPARLEITASMSGPPAAGDLGPVSATLTVQDADGVGHGVTTTAMPADGKPHELVASLATLANAPLPLRLIGVSVGYNTPAYRKSPAASVTAGPAVLKLDGASVSAAPAGPFPAPFATGSALATWHALSTDLGLASLLAELAPVDDDAVAPAIKAAAPAGGAFQITFDPGNGPLIPQPLPGTSATPAPGPAALSLDIPAAKLPVPVIATTAFTKANGLRLGTEFQLSIYGEPVACQLVATVSAFPAGASVVADQGAMQDALASQGDGGTLPVTGWWLSTVTGAAPAGLPAGSTVSDAPALTSRLEHNLLSAAPVQAIAAVAAAAALLAALGFCVSVAASTRERRPQRALLGALGVPPRTQAGLFCLEEALISIPAAAVGLAIGLALAHLLVPALTLTATGALPVPAVHVVLPLGWVILIAAGLPAVPVLAAAVTALRQPDPAAELRAAEAVA